NLTKNCSSLQGLYVVIVILILLVDSSPPITAVEKAIKQSET
ncbi:hypothetical protein CP02DC21_1869, partial [Chlamydia psittaci 02DC21]